MDLASIIHSKSKEGDLYNENGHLLLSNIQFAVTFWERAVGLMGKREDQAVSLLLVPCNTIHTYFMRFPIDVLFLSFEGEVIDFVKDVPPWKIFLRSPKADLCLETIAGKMPAMRIHQKVFIKEKED